MADFIFSCHGSIWLCNPQDGEADLHLRENVSDEAQWFGGALVVEPRYVSHLAAQLRENGYSVE
jgi:hypothetical protein